MKMKLRIGTHNMLKGALFVMERYKKERRK